MRNRQKMGGRGVSDRISDESVTSGGRSLVGTAEGGGEWVKLWEIIFRYEP